jgi:hypothetical protein
VHSAPWLERLEAGEVTRALPFLLHFQILTNGEWCADLVAREGPGADKYLEGDSYGVGVAFALASLHMEEPLPGDLVASAVVLEDGVLGRVDSLQQKIHMVWTWAPGVTRFLVAEPQQEEALEVARICAPGLEIVGAGSLASALDIAYPGYREHGSPAWRVAGRAAEAARHVYDLAIGSPALHDWAAVERSADFLASILEPDTDRHQDLVFAKAVTRRHQGRTCDPLPWIESENRTLSDLRRLAHVIQSATDSASPNLKEWVDKARSWATARSSDEELMVFGAIGRAQAALGAYGDARRTLGQAVEGWFERRRESEAGRPLCELLRILGLIGDVRSVIDLRPRIGACRQACEESSNPASAYYLPLAEARALVHLGQFAEALHLLQNDADWTGADDHVRDARVRWLARALDSSGDHAGGSRQRTLLADRGNTSSTALLAQMDHLLLEPGDDHADEGFGRLMDLLEEVDPSIVRLRHRVQGDTQRAQAERVAREYPY